MTTPAEFAELLWETTYLQPDHPDALLHLSLLAKKRGDVSGARRLQSRVRRVEEAAAR
jgi:chemotaxis protein methyltransferase WspC